MENKPSIEIYTKQEFFFKFSFIQHLSEILEFGMVSDLGFTAKNWILS